MGLRDFLSDLRIPVATSSFSDVLVSKLENFFDSPSWVNLVYIFKAAGLLASLILLFGVILVVIKANIIGMKWLPVKTVLKRPNHVKDPHFASQILKIKKMVSQKNPEEDRLAILAASQLLERGLAKVGQKSLVFRENVENIPYWSTVSPDKIFSAYSVRTKLLHNPDEQVSHEQVAEAVETFESALQDLGVI
jgi:hypothetical protein